MDQLHEELKTPVAYSDDDSDGDNNDNEDGNNSARIQVDIHSNTAQSRGLGEKVILRD